MAFDRLQALKNIEQQLPMASAEQEKQLKAAQAIRMKQGVAAAPAMADAQQLGAQSAAQRGAIELQQQQALQQGTLQARQAVGAEQQAVAQQELFNQQQAVEKRIGDQGQRLFHLNAAAKQELVDKEMQIKTDTLGRQVLSTRQAADWAITNAKNQEELKDFAQKSQIAMERKAQIIKHAYALVQQEMKEQSAKGMQEQNQAFTMEMRGLSKGLQKWIDDLEAKGTKFSQQMTMGGTIVGGVVGGVVGGYFTGGTGAVQGAMGGAVIGGAAGQAYAGSQGSANSAGLSNINTNVDSGSGYNRQY